MSFSQKINSPGSPVRPMRTLPLPMSPSFVVRRLALIAILATTKTGLVAQDSSVAGVSPYVGVYFGTFDGGRGRWGMAVSWAGEGHFDFVGRFANYGPAIRSYPYASEVFDEGSFRCDAPIVRGSITEGRVTGEAALRYSVNTPAGASHIVEGQIDRTEGTGVAYAGYWQWSDGRVFPLATTLDVIVGPSGTTFVVVKTPSRGDEDGMTVIAADGTLDLALPSGTRVSARVDPNTGKLLATVSLDGAPTPADAAVRTGKVVNFSTLAAIGANQQFTHGFTIAGGTGKRVLFRAVGSPLATILGRGAYLANPILSLLQGSARIAVNDDWNSDDPALRRAFAETGAWPLPDGSKDAALIARLPPGNYVMVASSAERGASGTALAEIFDLEPDNGSLLNLSTQGSIGAGSGELVSGFVIAGEQPRSVLIRAVGPKLADFGAYSGTPLADPQLKVRTSAGVTVAANDNWSSFDPALLAATQQAGTLYLDAGSKDAALLVTLAPGAYTATVSSADGGSGLVMVEIFDAEPPPPPPKASLAVEAFTIAGEQIGNQFSYRARLRLRETSGASAVTVTLVSLKLEDWSAPYRIPPFAPPLDKTIAAGTARELIEEDVYGDPEIEWSASEAWTIVSATITYRDSAGNEHSISTLTQVAW